MNLSESIKEAFVKKFQVILKIQEKIDLNKTVAF